MVKVKDLNWCIIYKKEQSDDWNLPFGFANEMVKQNIKLKRIEYLNSDEFKLPDKKFILRNNINILLIFHAGFNINLNNSLIKFRKNFPNVIIINELGDEPQTQKCNLVRAALSDISLSPDYDSYLYWRNKGFNCYWFTHWADESIFINKKIGNKRPIFIGTTMGPRKYSLMMKIIFWKKFKNIKTKSSENTIFYNSSLIAFQYARWGEITRRIFEAASCGCCVVTNSLKDGKNLQSIFKHNESIILYKNRVHLIYELIKLIFNRKKIERIAYNGEFIVRNFHTTKIRVKELVRIVEDTLKSKKNFF